jgi:hypothetical protein
MSRATASTFANSTLGYGREAGGTSSPSVAAEACGAVLFDLAPASVLYRRGYCRRHAREARVNRTWCARHSYGEVDMGIAVFKGKFYEFHKERIVSRPGAPLEKRVGLEVGPEISRADAIERLKKKGDVYTLAMQDAKTLSLDACPGRRTPQFESPHIPSNPTATGREDVYFQHFHPGGLHPSDPGGLGHVFFGERGERFGS